MQLTTIPWVPWPEKDIPGYSWNPVTGCTPISDGCKNCYAKAMFKRFKWHDFGTPTFHENRINDPLKKEKPCRIFVNSMGDLFHKEVRESWFNAVMDVIKETPHHTYFVLTKRPYSMIVSMYSWLTRMQADRNPYPDNLQIGLTIASQKDMQGLHKIRTDTTILRNFHFLSVEPLLEPINLKLSSLWYGGKVSWVIAGPETGPGARYCDPEWIHDIAKQCAEAKVPFFDKTDPSDPNFTRREWV